MPCMTYAISFCYGKSHINGSKKLGPMLLCMTSSCIILRCLAFGSSTSSCIILHCLAPPCIIMHGLASSCIILHHLASSCIILHHLAQIQLQPKFARPRLWWRQQDFHKGAAQLSHCEPSAAGSCLHTTHSSQVMQFISWHLRQSTTKPFHTMWESFYMKFFKFSSQCNFPIIHLQHPTQRHHKKMKQRPQCVHKRHGCATWTKHFAFRNPETCISVR